MGALDGKVAVVTGAGRGIGKGVGVGAVRYCPVLSAPSLSLIVTSDIANPTPSTWRPSAEKNLLNVLMPTISPDASTIGPPLFPGLIAASDWISQRSAKGSYRTADTMPVVTVAPPGRLIG